MSNPDTPRLTDEQIDSALETVMLSEHSHEDIQLCSIITQLRTELAAKDEALEKATEALKKTESVAIEAIAEAYYITVTIDGLDALQDEVHKVVEDYEDQTLAEIKEASDG